MNKLKVLCCSGSLDGGGSERQLLQFACGLPAEKYSAAIFLQHLRGPLLDEVPARINIFSPDEKQRTSNWLPGSAHRAQVDYLSKLINDSGFQVVYDRTYHATLLTSVACRKTPAARVSVIVSPPSRDLGQSDEKFFWLKRSLLRRAYRDRAALTLAVSQETANDAASFYGLAIDQIQVVPNPVDCERVRRLAESRSVPMADQAEGSTKQILCVGRFTKEKGQAELILAIADSKARSHSTRWHLTLLGDGPRRKLLEKTVRDLEISDQVTFAGFVENPHPWIAKADCVCIPSKYEGLPNVALEAMALGTPIVATRASDALVQLLGEDEQRGYLTSGQTYQQISRRLEDRFSEDPAVVEGKTQAAKRWVEEHHGIAPWLQRMQDLLAEALRRKELSWRK